MSDNQQAQPQVATTSQTPTAGRKNVLREKFGDNWDAADESYNNIVQQRQHIEQELNETKQVLNELVEQRVSPRQQAQQRSAFDKLAEIGLPPDTIREAMKDLVREELQPLARGLQARDAIMARYPEFVQEEPQFQKFLRDNRDTQERYSRMAALDPEMAMDWGIAKYQQHKAETGTASTTGAQRSQAQLPNTVQQSGGRAVSTGEPDPEAMQKALEYYRTTGDDRPLLQERLKGQGHPMLQQQP
jgi:hypothetical protein